MQARFYLRCVVFLIILNEFLSYHLFVSYLALPFISLSPEKNCTENKTVSAILIPCSEETNMSVKNGLTADNENNLTTSLTTEWNCKDLVLTKKLQTLRLNLMSEEEAKSKPTANNKKSKNKYKIYSRKAN